MYRYIVKSKNMVLQMDLTFCELDDALLGGATLLRPTQTPALHSPGYCDVLPPSQTMSSSSGITPLNAAVALFHFNNFRTF